MHKDVQMRAAINQKLMETGEREGFPGGSSVKNNPPAMRETWVQSLGWEDTLEKGTATYSSIMAWRIPWTVWSMALQRVRHD